MSSPDMEAIETYMSITGVSESTAIQKLQEHGGNLNEAVNAHFTEGERSITHERFVAAPLDDMMDVDDPVEVGPHRHPFPLMPSSRNLNPFSLLEPDFTRSIFDSGPDNTNSTPYVSHPREVREIPIEVKDGNSESGHSGHAPTIEDVTETAQAPGPEIHGTVIIDDDDDDGEDITTAPPARAPGWTEQRDRPIAPRIDDLPDYSNDIEEEMVRAAIEASKRDAENQQFGATHDLSDPMPRQRQSQLEDVDLAHAVSLSLKTAEQDKALREVGENAGASSESEARKSSEKEGFGNLASSNGRLDVGSSSVQDDFEDVEEQPLVRHGTRRVLSGSLDPGKENEAIDVSSPASPASPQGHAIANDPPPNGGGFPSDEWGGISSLEHDEAVMLEAALFGGIPEGSGYHFPYAPHQFMQNGLERDVGPYLRRMPRPPSPSLEAQRLIREQQDDEYLASLQADREKELKAIEEAEARRLEVVAASEEKRRKLEEEQEIERQLAATEASLPQEPMPEDENAVTLLVRMPDGSRRGRRFLKSDKLQHLFDFIDIGRGIKPGTYRLVRPYPRRAFSVGEGALTLDELGLASKQEALFLELV